MLDFGLLEPILLPLLLIAFWAPMASHFLDQLLDFGHIFGWIRYKLMIRASYDSAEGKEARTALFRLKAENISLGDKIQKANELYWRIAGTNTKYVLLLCNFCMAIRMAIIAYLAISIYLLFTVTIQVAAIQVAALFIFGLPVTYLAHSLVSRLVVY